MLKLSTSLCFCYLLSSPHKRGEVKLLKKYLPLTQVDSCFLYRSFSCITQEVGSHRSKYKLLDNKKNSYVIQPPIRSDIQYQHSEARELIHNIDRHTHAHTCIQYSYVHMNEIPRLYSTKAPEPIIDF